MSSQGSLNDAMSKPLVLGLQLWVLICIGVGAFIVLILCILFMWMTFLRKSRSFRNLDPPQIPDVSKDIRIDRVGARNSVDRPDNIVINVNDLSSEHASEKMAIHLGRSVSNDADNLSQCSAMYNNERALSSVSGEEGNSVGTWKQNSYSHLVNASPLVGMPEGSHLGWGHWFTLRDLEYATNRFSSSNVIGEGGYGVVYKGRLVSGSDIAVKKILNNLYASLLSFLCVDTYNQHI